MRPPVQICLPPLVRRYYAADFREALRSIRPGEGWSLLPPRWLMLCRKHLGPKNPLLAVTHVAHVRLVRAWSPETGRRCLLIEPADARSRFLFDKWERRLERYGDPRQQPRPWEEYRP
jgi:hypothetical protein